MNPPFTYKQAVAITIQVERERKMNPVCEFCGANVPREFGPYVVETDDCFGHVVHWVCPECVDSLYESLPG